jgi:predicted nucleic acid-binding protein
VKSLLFDVNVVLDVLLDRPPFAEAARALWAAAERREIEAFIPAHCATTVFYIVARQRDARFARRVTEDLLSVSAVAAVDGSVLRRALTLPGPDFEDAVCLAAAEAAGCGALVTRDPAGYRGAGLPIVDPRTALALLGRRGPGGVGEPRVPRVKASPLRRAALR